MTPTLTRTLAPTRYVQTTDDVLRVARIRFGRYIKRFALAIAKDDRQLATDLEQEALIALWELDPTRFDESDDGYVRAKLRARMVRVARAERRLQGGGRRVR